MTDYLFEQVRQSLKTIGLRRHQLLIICETFGGSHVHAIAKEFHFPWINVNLALSTVLKDLPVRRRPHKVKPTLSDAIKHTGEQVVCLDHIEICFEPSLKQDPLLLFEHLSRELTLIVSWKGTYDHDKLVYAVPDHIEYVRSGVDGVVIQT